MGWLGRIFGVRRRTERRRAAERAVRGLLDRSGPRAAWLAVIPALRLDPDSTELLHAAADILRQDRETVTAELFDRAADAPHDPQRLFELGSALLTNEEASFAVILLSHALRFVPFDAVVRSELAVAQARDGRPDEVLGTLALHPCLADDPGALFEFGWASLLTGDSAAAARVLRELRGTHPLREKLRLALERAAVGNASEPPDARDFYFIEHGGLLLDSAGPFGGRYKTYASGDAQIAKVLEELARFLDGRVQHIVQPPTIDSTFTERVAEATGLAVRSAGAGAFPEGLVCVRSDKNVRALLRENRDMDRTVLFAMTVDPSRSLRRAPDIVGAFATEVSERGESSAEESASSELQAFVERRAEWLAPARDRVRSAYVPDAPLPLPRS